MNTVNQKTLVISCDCDACDHWTEENNHGCALPTIQIENGECSSFEESTD